MKNRSRLIGILSVAVLFIVMLTLAGCGGKWGETVYTYTIQPYKGVVAGPPDDSTGGWKLEKGTAAWTQIGTVADIVIDNYGMIGAVGIARSRAGFNTTPEPSLTYVTTLRATVGDVFVIVLRNGKHAKIRIDNLTPGIAWYTYGNISFSYMLEQ